MVTSESTGTGILNSGIISFVMDYPAIVIIYCRSYYSCTPHGSYKQHMFFLGTSGSADIN